MKARVAGSRRNAPEALRARILDAAMRLFQTQGYHATGMRDVMQAAETTPGAFAHHFPTKELLALAVIRERVGPVVRESWIDPACEAASLDAGIGAVFAEIVRGVEQRKSVTGCPLNNLAMELAFSSPQFRDALQTIFQAWERALAERIGKTRGGRKLDRVGREAAASFIIATYSGAMNLAKTMQSALPLRTAAANLAAWLQEREYARDPR